MELYGSLCEVVLWDEVKHHKVLSYHTVYHLKGLWSV